MNKNIREIKVNQVRIRDPFWSPKQELVTDVMIPYQEKILHDGLEGVEKSHAIENFKIAAGLSKDEFYGMVFQDSDVAKWLEGVAYSLAIKPDPSLEQRADEVIEIIEKAQQPDGYLNTYFTIKEPEHRWQNLQECHELYCAGHMMEAAVAYYEATGKDRLLNVMRRMADHIDARFGSDKEYGIPGHQEVEIGLMRLYHTTGEQRYKDLARFFIDARGTDPDFFLKEKDKRGWTHFGSDPENREYTQCHAPVYDQNEAVGHSVRAVYMYTAMSYLAASDGDGRLYAACERLWDNMVNRRMYLTGGIGSTVDGEAFSIDYDLPNDTVYAETCASIGLVFFAGKMLDQNPDGRFADVMERALYNGIISGMQLDGRRFFYVNPLEVNPGISGELYGHKHVLPQRPGWYACACCPTNMVRLLTSLGRYAWGEDENTIYSHLFVGQEAELEKAHITVESRYPWEGAVAYHIHGKSEEEFTLAIHIPEHVRELKILLNGENKTLNMKKGYHYMTRVWESGDKVELLFDMPVRKIYANQEVREDAGCAALMRGPIVYCFEGIDNGPCLQSLRLPQNTKVKTHKCEEGMLKGNMLLTVNGYRMEGGTDLYSEQPPKKIETELTAIPYYTWGNRGLNQMRVWLLEV